MKYVTRSRICPLLETQGLATVLMLLLCFIFLFLFLESVGLGKITQLLQHCKAICIKNQL